MNKIRTCIYVSLICLLLLSGKKNASAVVGVISLGMDDQVVIVENSHLRSKISYYVQEDMARELKEYLGYTIWARGIVTDRTTVRWEKEIYITSYQFITPIIIQ